MVYTEAQLTKANTEVNRNGDYTSKLLFVNLNDEIKSVILTTWVEDYNSQNNIVNAIVYLNEYDGTFIDAYKIENGRFTKRLVPKTKMQTASFFMLQDIFTPDCWNTDDLEGGELETVNLGTIRSGSGSYDDGNTSGPANGPSIGDYGGYVDEGISRSGGAYTGDDSIAPNGVDLGATTILMNPPKGNEDPTEVKPCEGDPIIGKLEIAPQYGQSGTKGALHGCTRYGAGCTSPDGRTKLHNGIDIKNPYGAPVYAMYDGFIFSTKNDSDGAGYYTRIQSTANGKTFIHEYFHLQKENRILQGNPLVKVKAGDIIGYQGDSGNLKGAIKKKTVDSHVHIEIREHDGSNKWGYANFTPVDPRTYFSTTIKDDGTSEPDTNCN